MHYLIKQSAAHPQSSDQLTGYWRDLCSVQISHEASLARAYQQNTVCIRPVEDIVKSTVCDTRIIVLNFLF